MKIGVVLLLVSAILLYMGIDQIAHDPRFINREYPASFVLGSMTPGLMTLFFAVRRLIRALSAAAPRARTHLG